MTEPAQFQKCIVKSTASVRQAMQAISSGAAGIALVVREAGYLKGTITDGDVRRALLNGASLDGPLDACLQKNFTAVRPEVGRAEVLDLMQARLLDQIPVVDDCGVLVGLHLLHEMLGSEERPNVAVIMAGGLGMRLRPFTEHVPKPMIKVAGRPILERLLLHLVGCGIRKVYMAVHHLAHVIEDHFGGGARFGCSIKYLREEEPLGTGGPLSLLKERPAEPFIVMNGDLITQADIPAMLRFHGTGGYAATMAVRRYGHVVPFGCVEVEEGRIVRLEEKPVLERSINAGMYILNPPLLDKIPRGFFPITALFDRCLEEGEAVGAFEVEEEWVDVGQPEQLKPGHVK